MVCHLTTVLHYLNIVEYASLIMTDHLIKSLTMAHDKNLQKKTKKQTKNVHLLGKKNILCLVSQRRKHSPHVGHVIQYHSESKSVWLQNIIRQDTRSFLFGWADSKIQRSIHQSYQSHTSLGEGFKDSVWAVFIKSLQYKALRAVSKMIELL